METLKIYARLLRTGQWYKNLLIFTAWITGSSGAHEPKELLLALLGFCAVSSITYITNDWLDCEKDRLHPIKKNRPLASGKISGKQALLVGLILGAWSIGVMMELGAFYTSILLSYVSLTTLYSLGLKNIPLVDLLLILTNFLLRTLAGFKTLPIQEDWAYLFLIAGLVLLLLTHKRRSDNKLLGAKAIEHKAVLGFYTPLRCHLLRVLAFLILMTGFFQGYLQGWNGPTLILLSPMLIHTSQLLSKEPTLSTKPKYLFKNKIWVGLLIGLILLQL